MLDKAREAVAEVKLKHRQRREQPRPSI